MKLKATFEKSDENANQIDHAICESVPSGCFAEIQLNFKNDLPSKLYFPEYVLFKEGGEFSIGAKHFKKEMPDILAKGITNNPVSVEVTIQVGENDNCGMPKYFETKTIKIANNFSEPTKSFRQLLFHDGYMYEYQEDHRYNNHNLNNPNNLIKKYYLKKTSHITTSYQNSNFNKDFFEEWIAPL